MHRRWAKDGLVCLSVSVDELEQRDAALRFLKQQNAEFSNFLLNEDADLWQHKWRVKAPPAVFVFDRLGRRVAKFDFDDPDKPFSYEDVEKQVEPLLSLHR